jgi:hypothetical protein
MPPRGKLPVGIGWWVAQPVGADTSVHPADCPVDSHLSREPFVDSGAPHTEASNHPAEPTARAPLALESEGVSHRRRSRCGSL